MSNFHALATLRNARYANINIALVVFALIAIGVGVHMLHSYLYPYPMGYLCPSVEGVVGHIYHQEKVGRPYFIEGKRVTKEEYLACVMVELPHP